MNPGDEPNGLGRFLHHEAPYIVVVAVVMLLLISSALAPREHPTKGPKAAPPAKSEAERIAALQEKATTDPLVAAFFWASNAVVVAGVGVLLWAVVRVGRHRHVLPVQPPPDVRWTGWDVVKVVAVYVLVLVLLGGGSAEESARPWLTDIGARVCMVAVALWVVLHQRRSPPAGIGLAKTGVLHAVGIGALGYLAIIPCLLVADTIESVAVKALGWHLPQQVAAQMIIESRSPLLLTALAVLVLVIAPVSEELFFRGLFQGLLTRRFGGDFAIAASAALFTLAHGDIQGVLGLLVLGGVLAYVYDRTRSLAAPITLHVLFNATAFITLMLARR